MENNLNSRIYAVMFVVAASVAIGFLSFRVLRPFLAAIAWATVLAVAFQGPWRSLRHKLPWPRSLAPALITLGIALLLLLPACLFASVLVSQAIDVAGQVNTRLQDQHVASFSDVIALPVVDRALDRIQELFGLRPEDVQRFAQGFASRASATLAGLSARLVLGVFNVVLTFAATLFLLFFFFRDGERMGDYVIGLIPTDSVGRSALRGSFREIIAAIFRGSLLCSLAQGATGALGWWLAGLPSPALAGAAMAILSLLPLGGTALVWIPGSLWAWWSGSHGAAIFLFLWCAIVTSFLADNVLRPILIGRSEELSTLLVFLGVFGGLSAFGILGIFIGPVTLAMGMSLLEVIRRNAEMSERPISVSPPSPGRP